MCRKCSSKVDAIQKQMGGPYFWPSSKVATLEPGGVFKEYDVHIVQSLETPLFQMDAISANY